VSTQAAPRKPAGASPAMAKKNFYAVACGRVPGLYGSWAECEAQVKGHPGAKYEGFTTRPELSEFVPTPCSSQQGSPNRPEAEAFVAAFPVTTSSQPGTATAQAAKRKAVEKQKTVGKKRKVEERGVPQEGLAMFFDGGWARPPPPCLAVGMGQGEGG
jgi:viroplasmin and RNaseH domain-containing protein